MTLAIVAAALCAFVGNAADSTTITICFNFDELGSGSGPAAMEAYMESVNGSDITVLNTVVGDGSGDLGPDSYVQNDPSCGERWFTFSFNEVPITSVSFDWAVDKSAFHALAAFVDDDDDDDD